MKLLSPLRQFSRLAVLLAAPLAVADTASAQTGAPAPPPSTTETTDRPGLLRAGAWYFTNAEVVEQIEYYRRGLSLDGIITHRFTLDEAPEAYRLFKAGQAGKVVFTRPGLT